MAASSTRPWAIAGGGVVVAVRLTPKGGRDGIDGIEQMADGRSVLKARVAAPPSEGEANAALCKLIGKALKIAPRNVTVAAGATSRIKRLAIAGDGPSLIAALEKLAGR